jgi:predicted NBD/HSP70 family sugar kinase
MNDTLLFDIGAFHMRFAWRQTNESFTEPIVVHTPEKFEDAMQIVTNVVENKNPEYAFGGIAGPMDKQREMILDGNQKEWNGKPIKKEIEKRIKKVYIENDTAMVGLGESIFGAGKEFDIVAYITVSSGVNGVRIVDKKIDRNAVGFEIGKQIISLDGSTLEDHVGGFSLTRSFGKLPSDIDDRSVWKMVERDLSIGVANTILHWSPNVVIVGGSVTKKLSIENLQNEVQNRIGSFFEVPACLKGDLGDFGGLWGALVWSNEMLV